MFNMLDFSHIWTIVVCLRPAVSNFWIPDEDRESNFMLNFVDPLSPIEVELVRTDPFLTSSATILQVSPIQLFEMV